MTIQEFFRKLANTVLSNQHLALSGDVDSMYHERMIYYLNDGLLKLFTRFKIDIHVKTLVVQEGNTDYFIDDNLIQILRVMDEKYRDQPLNINNRKISFYISNKNSIRVPAIFKKGTVFHVEYKNRHPILSEYDLDAEINMPDVLNAALSFYVAAMYYLSLNTAEAQNIGQGYMMQYEAACSECELLNASDDSEGFFNPKFFERGFV